MWVKIERQKTITIIEIYGFSKLRTTLHHIKNKMTSEEPTKVAPADVSTADTSEVKDEAEVPKEYDEKTLQDVAERLKFFLSDANIRQDYFLRKFLISKGDGDPGGAVPVDVLLKFNTIKSITMDPDVVVKAVSTLLADTLQVRSGGGSIARVEPFTEALLNENIPLSLYVRNLPTKEDDRKNVQYDVTMDELRNMFETYGKVAIVKLRFKKSAQSDDDDHTDDIKTEADTEENGDGNRRKPRRRFPLGACLVEFESKESFDKAVADVLTLKDGEPVEPKRKLEAGGKTLEVLTLKEYVNSLKKSSSHKKRNRDEEDTTNEEEITAANEKADAFTIEWQPGCVVSLKSLPENCDREAILDVAMAACELTEDEMKEKKVYADYSRGQKDGALRFPDPQLAKKMLDKVKSETDGVELAGAKWNDASLLEGDAEKKYWEEFIEFKKKQIRHRAEERKNNKGRNNNKRRKGGGRGGGGGGHW